jgi:hypothetical protein
MPTCFATQRNCACHSPPVVPSASPPASRTLHSLVVAQSVASARRYEPDPPATSEITFRSTLNVALRRPQPRNWIGHSRNRRLFTRNGKRITRTACERVALRYGYPRQEGRRWRRNTRPGLHSRCWWEKDTRGRLLRPGYRLRAR